MSLRREPEAFCGNLDEVVINSHMTEVTGFVCMLIMRIDRIKRAASGIICDI